MNLSDIEKLKQLAANTAIDYVVKDTIIGVGTGSTVKYFIQALSGIKHAIKGAVASSIETEKALHEVGIPLVKLESGLDVSVYIDGADQVNSIGQMIKGGGGALTREKIIAAVAEQFVCIVDETKTVSPFGCMSVPIEVIPMARSYVAVKCVQLGGIPALRDNFVTDNGNVILDVAFGSIREPIALEEQLNQLTGVVTNGIFASRSANILLIGTKSGIKLQKFN